MKIHYIDLARIKIALDLREQHYRHLTQDMPEIPIYKDLADEYQETANKIKRIQVGENIEITL